MIPTIEDLKAIFPDLKTSINLASISKVYSPEVIEFRKMLFDIFALFCDIAFFKNNIKKIKLNGYFEEYFENPNLDYSPIAEFINEINSLIEIEKYNEQLIAVPLQYINVNIFRKDYLHKIFSRIVFVLSFISEKEWNSYDLVVVHAITKMIFHSFELFKITPMEVLEPDDDWNPMAYTLKPSEEDYTRYFQNGILKKADSIRSTNYSNRKVIVQKLDIILNKRIKNIWKLLNATKARKNMRDEIGLEKIYPMFPQDAMVEIGKMLGKDTPEMLKLTKHFDTKLERRKTQKMRNPKSKTTLKTTLKTSSKSKSRSNSRSSSRSKSNSK